MQRLLRSGDVARIMAVSPKTVSRWAKEGFLESARTLGGHRRYDPKVVEALRIACGVPDPKDGQAVTPPDDRVRLAHYIGAHGHNSRVGSLTDPLVVQALDTMHRDDHENNAPPHAADDYNAYDDRKEVER